MDFSKFQDSNNTVDDVKHQKIVENVINLDKKRKLKKTLRNEPALTISEFNLVKSLTGSVDSVQLDQLTNVLKNKKKHARVFKSLEHTKVKARTLVKRLEKPQQDRLKRVLMYEKNRFKFDRWEAFVQLNRASSHQVFPLGIDKIDKSESNDFTKNWKYKSELQKKLEQLETPVEEYLVEDEHQEEETQKLTYQQLKKQRQEAAKLRAHQSYREAKACRQNKIKSKKYHRILRKEKIKAAIKEFEQLQQTDPEEALKKLDEIEKARALERFSLRHKGTGQWAKNKQIRAKYDQQTRQILAEQLKISRDLTQKIKPTIESSEEEHSDNDETKETDEIQMMGDEKNPWTSLIKPSKEVSEFVAGYKKFWAEKVQENEQSQTNSMEKTQIQQSKSTKKLKNIKSANKESSQLKEQKSTKIEKFKKIPKKLGKVKKIDETNRAKIKVKKSVEIKKKLKKSKKIVND